MQERHEMILEEVRSTDAEEWHCPQCGRRFIMRWPPNYEKVVLEPGDEGAVHVGGKGGMSIGAVDLVPTSEADSPVVDQNDWVRWLEENGIDWDGPAA